MYSVIKYCMTFKVAKLINTALYELLLSPLLALISLSRYLLFSESSCKNQCRNRFFFFSMESSVLPSSVLSLLDLGGDPEETLSKKEFSYND